MRIAGPSMDRIDLRIEVPAVTDADLILPPPSEGAAEVAARVAAARDVQLARYAAAGMPHVRTNAEAPASLLETIAQPDAQGQKLLRDAADTMKLTARGYHRVLRVARTLADLDGAEKIGRLHLAEALSYRDRKSTRLNSSHQIISYAVFCLKKKKKKNQEKNEEIKQAKRINNSETYEY